MMKILSKILTEKIVKENDFAIISKLDDETKQRLKEHIQNSILEKCDYQILEYLQEMIEVAIDKFEDELRAIIRISSLKYTINDVFYEKLKEPYVNSDNLDLKNYASNNSFDIPLNKYTLVNFIEFNIIDGVDLIVEETVKQMVDCEFPFLNVYKKMLQNVLKAFSEPLSKREIALLSFDVLSAFLKLNGLEWKKNINIKNNTPQTNQKILDNSYDEIINKLQKLPNTDNVIDLLTNEKLNHCNLFTNGKKLSKVKSNNHYMSFLYKCATVITEDNNLIVFQEFTEALISGYMQYLEFEDKSQKNKSYEQELKVLKKYNISNENDKNIKELEDKIKFLSIAKPHQKFIPFKELANRLEIDTNQISNYITYSLNNRTNRKTIKQIFDTLQTIPKEICISQF